MLYSLDGLLRSELTNTTENWDMYIYDGAIPDDVESALTLFDFSESSVELYNKSLAQVSLILEDLPDRIKFSPAAQMYRKSTQVNEANCVRPSEIRFDTAPDDSFRLHAWMMQNIGSREFGFPFYMATAGSTNLHYVFDAPFKLTGIQAYTYYSGEATTIYGRNSSSDEWTLLGDQGLTRAYTDVDNTDYYLQYKFVGGRYASFFFFGDIGEAPSPIPTWALLVPRGLELTSSFDQALLCSVGTMGENVGAGLAKPDLNPNESNQLVQCSISSPILEVL